MFVKFTNAADSVLKGNPLYLNTAWIISVYEMPRDNGSVRTLIYGGSGPQCITWEVEESLGEVEKKLNRTYG